MTRTAVGGMFSISQAWTGSGCESLAPEWPPTPALVPETTRTHLQGHLLCFEYVSPSRSKCVCLGLSLWTLKAFGEFWTLLLARNPVVLCAAW